MKAEGLLRGTEKCRQESPQNFKLKLDVCSHSAGQRGGSTILLLRHRLDEYSHKPAFRLTTG